MTWQKILALSILLYFTGFNKPVGIICHLDNDFHQQFFFSKEFCCFMNFKSIKTIQETFNHLYRSHTRLDVGVAIQQKLRQMSDLIKSDGDRIMSYQ